MSKLIKLSNLARRKILNVAEKPSAAKEISKILSKQSAKFIPSLSKYNPIYEFNYKFGEEDVLMSFTSVTGHIMSYQFEEKYSKKFWNTAPHEHLLRIAKVLKTLDPAKSQLAKNLVKLSKTSDTIILWLDCDREGEAIAYEVLDICKEANPNLKVLRAQFSAFTQKEIQEAMKTLRDPNPNLASAVDSRQEIDLRIGATFTRFQTNLLKKNFREFDSQVISYGPCQFPTLGFVVERWKKIQTFKSDPFWYIVLNHQEGNSSEAVAEFESERGNFTEKEKADKFYAKIMSKPEAVVIEVTESPKNKPRPVPLSTIAMQKLGTSKLGLSSHKIMESAERLYNKGYISYPRTETDVFITSFDLKNMISTQISDAKWGNYAKMLLDENKFKWPKPGGHDDKSHPPIHPVKALPIDADEFSNDDRKIFELITRHFLACCSQDAKGSETVVKIDISGEIFTAKGLQIEQYNWLDVYPYERWIGNLLPPFAVGKKFIPSKINLKESKTKPPNLLTENELIGLMDKHGIGTDATIHEHIKTIQDRLYVEKNGNNFVPTKLGEALVTSYENIGIDLWKPTLRASMEASMTAISKGNMQKEAFLDECLNKMEQIFAEVKDKQSQLVDSFKRYYEPKGPVVAFQGTNFSGSGQSTAAPDQNSIVNAHLYQDLKDKKATFAEKKSLHSFGLFTKAKKSKKSEANSEETQKKVVKETKIKLEKKKEITKKEVDEDVKVQRRVRSKEAEEKAEEPKKKNSSKKISTDSEEKIKKPRKKAATVVKEESSA